jgi:hypothetical protein
MERWVLRAACRFCLTAEIKMFYTKAARHFVNQTEGNWAFGATDV